MANKHLLLWLLPCLVLLSGCGGKEQKVRPRAQHVVLVGIDGWAAEAVRLAPKEDLPNIRGLMEQGSWTLSKRSVMPSSSAINWASMLNGLPTEMHGFSKWNSTSGTIPPTLDNGHGLPPTVFTLLREQRPDAVSACLYEWDGIGGVADTLAMSFHRHCPAAEEGLPALADFTRQGIDYIQAEKPDFFFLCYDSQDATGHHYGWYGQEYMDWQKALDTEIGKLIQALKDAGIYENTVIVLSSDHGGKDKGHGGFTLQELETPFIVCGKGIRQNYEFPLTVMQYDTAAILADLLGLTPPAEWRGRAFPQIYQ